MSRSIFGWDLPPGCRVSDIPGNRPEDIAYETMCEEIDVALWPLVKLIETAQRRKTSAYNTAAYEKAHKAVLELIEGAHKGGYETAVANAAEEKYWREQEQRDKEMEAAEKEA